jgi:hypothetical protein
MAEAAIFAVLFCVLFWVMPVQSHAADTAGKVTGFIGETYYKNGKVQKKKAVFDNGSWYVTDKSGNKVRGTTYKIRGKSYRLREPVQGLWHGLAARRAGHRRWRGAGIKKPPQMEEAVWGYCTSRSMRAM